MVEPTIALFHEPKNHRHFCNFPCKKQNNSKESNSCLCKPIKYILNKNNNNPNKCTKVIDPPDNYRHLRAHLRQFSAHTLQKARPCLLLRYIINGTSKKIKITTLWSIVNLDCSFKSWWLKFWHILFDLNKTCCQN